MVKCRERRGFKHSIPLSTFHFALHCSPCQLSYPPSANPNAPFTFTLAPSLAPSPLDLRQLLPPAAKKKAKQRWTDSHSKLLRLLLRLFGRNFPLFQQLLPDFPLSHLKLKARTLSSPPPPNPALSQASRPPLLSLPLAPKEAHQSPFLPPQPPSLFSPNPCLSPKPFFKAFTPGSTAEKPWLHPQTPNTPLRPRLDPLSLTPEAVV